ncbi:MAG TPA: CDP-alcohol phosphatidyltransferase family protein, partial [Dermatophilaceae bacterium]|nr:CDP-alcohol phosphatidyltransferase family protein [Dermatophilaceae bacterium]HQH90414.1 CDP-alcohol phosphatidyltransferase family protein [Dermatophilaceae bacterium]HQK60888.1 CDP-alcohol phosphatidyltransferase family protein [Dermatophilaceae bacterium]
MLNRLLRASWTKVMTPIAKAFLAIGLTPDAVTIIGTLAVCVSALAFYPRGEFLTGTLLITLFIFSDNVDGVMARLSGRQGVWGAFLDSTLDRVGDAAIFGGL